MTRVIKIGIRDELNTLENYQKTLEFNRGDNIYLLKDIESLKEDEKEGIQKRKFSNSEVIRKDMVVRFQIPFGNRRLKQ